ncbi:MAG: shikimate kinase AroK [Gammaproteobacteria bacterium]|nr:shikimate kinase AroK [Gammaproteobacteria bacterium]MDH5801738.1 shikimate kinase AroK [Gammaproteobacteria bacterium]
MPRNLIFVGPMGAGKTTIGRMVAKQLKRQFYDSDREIERRTGASIPLIFELEQEQGFRLRERSVIQELSQMDRIVLATGGGAILDEQNRTALSQGGHVFYLKASINHLLNRTSRDSSRPLLQTDNPRQKLEELMQIREPLYCEVANSIITTDTCPVRKIVDRIIKIVKNQDL